MDFEQIVLGAGDAIMVCDGAGAITLWNPSCERIFGFTEAEVLGRSMDLIVPERQRQRHWDGYAVTMKSGVTKYGTTLLKVPALHKDGHTLSIAFSVSLVKAADGSVESIVAIVRDESARFAEDRKLRTRLVELELQIKNSVEKSPAAPAEPAPSPQV